MSASELRRLTPTAVPLHPPDEWECGLQLSNVPRAARVARAAFRTALDGLRPPREVADTAELLTGELVGNAVRHAEGQVCVRARVREGVLRISVRDEHPDLPGPVPVTFDDAHGRGLLLVERLARAWGRYALLSGAVGGRVVGKVVWCELDCSTTRTS
ncbi:ATP-binding protein [Streptomyces sp. XM4193]|uniref:ATP-binding protein n=1 Tax=Streptomyces sp. XM4193 TaxID=2929782 RepID=UPI001FF74945|nr:ATP-binding protein [Streptomyces sp. XM4193]MCK1795385.1 ATP-binding protein [Streptomyces sp. XM4193]